jgi:sn-glycerol 3-phosphate transport system substrate-binding protein
MKKMMIVAFLMVTLLVPLYSAGTKEVVVDENAPVTIEFWHAMSGDRIDLIQGIVDDFMKENPNITVNVQYSGSYNETLNKVVSAHRAGNAPSVFHLYEVGTLGMIKSGMVVAVDELATKFNQPINWDEFFVPVHNYYKYQGQHYSMPFNSSTPLVYINKTLFERAGLDPNNPPKTFADIRKAAVALKNSGIDSPITWNLHSWYFEQMYCLQDAPFVNNSNGRGEELPTQVLFNQEAGVKSLEWWVGMYNDGLFMDVGPGWSNHRAAFGSGEAAMIMSSSSDVNLLTKTLEEKGWELGTGYLPRPQGATGGVAIGGGSLWLTQNHTPEEELAALKLVTYISSDKPQMAWHKGTGYFPVRKTAMDKLENEGWFVENPNYKTAFDQLLLSPESLNTAGSLLGVFPETRAIIEGKIQECYQGKDVKVALDEAAEEVNSLIAEWNEVIAFE